MHDDLTLPVRLFFQDFPWQGVAPAKGHPTPSVDLHLTVAQFWQQWPWQGGVSEALASTITVPTLAEWMALLEA
ncbi:MAG: hypothetical protein Q6L50_10870 [Gloeomargarita sp. GMQP_bins_120]